MRDTGKAGGLCGETTRLQRHLVKPLASCDKTAWALGVAPLVKYLPGMGNTPRASPQHQRFKIPALGGGSK